MKASPQPAKRRHYEPTFRIESLRLFSESRTRPASGCAAAVPSCSALSSRHRSGPKYSTGAALVKAQPNSLGYQAPNYFET